MNQNKKGRKKTMMYKYFEGCKTKNELRSRYVQLLKQYHPDNGGNEETCKAIIAEYEYLVNKLQDIEPETENVRKQAQKATSDLDARLREVINQIITFEGLNIEIVGLWIWVDGNSYPYKEELKKIGFTWSKARKKWHIAPYGENPFYPKGYKKDSFDGLRAKYGSEKIETEKPRNRIA